MRKVPWMVLLLLSALATLALAAGNGFDAGAVWQPKQKDQEKLWDDMRQCGAMMAGGSPGAFEACTGEAMRKHGAPAAAIAFNKATGGNAYATAFREMGTVDVMEALNPFQANSNDQIYFVNGTPAAVSVDAEAMKLDGSSSPAFLALQKTYPNAFIFPHAKAGSLQMAPAKDGGQSFSLAFPIVDGCHACARVGEATYEFDFDAAGNFTGTKIAAVAARD